MAITASKVLIPVDGETQEFSAILLRDLCQCTACIHHSTKQRLFSTADIPRDIQARSVAPNQSMSGYIDILWNQDAPGYNSDHTTSVQTDWLRGICRDGVTSRPFESELAPQTLWDVESYDLVDFQHEAYMRDDAVLYTATTQLRTHGLIFITNIPGCAKSVSTIAERIGAVKNTFYGDTWDGESSAEPILWSFEKFAVLNALYFCLLESTHTLTSKTVRTVPSAINVAYTSGDLGFHTDLLYFQNPAHIQLLHCMQSSSTGGASVFVDAFRCAVDLYRADLDAFNVLATFPVNYHYKHPESNLYTATKPIFDMRPLRIGDTRYSSLPEFLEAWERHRQKLRQSTDTYLPPLDVVDCLEKINWGPPFLAPFSLDGGLMEQARSSATARECLNQKVDNWHAAAQKFSSLLHRPECLHERLMKPGECVLFDNTRVLHARKAFDSGDVGKARWLRGTYVDKEPYLSKLRVLKHRFENPHVLVDQ